MIPVRLSLRNFMCYRENVPVLSFTGIRTACISGDNGNGKSALIDAITWALWGKARAKSDIDLIAQGQPEMSVEFDFEISGQNYRVVRKYSKPKSRNGAGHPILEFQVFNEGSFNCISGNTLTQTEEKIKEVLHMDYDTFINSAFLRQGHADEFTNKRPGERKDVLANILGFSQYDVIENKAKYLSKSYDDKSGVLQAAITAMEEDLKLKPSYESELETTQNDLKLVESAVRDRETRVNGLRKQLDLLESNKEQLIQLRKHNTEIQSMILSCSAQVNRHQVKVNEYEGLLTGTGSIEDGYKQFILAKNLNEEFNQKLGSLLKLNEQKNKLEKNIDKVKNDLLREQAVSARNVADLERKIEKLPQFKAELITAEGGQNKLNDLETALEARKQTRQELQSRISILSANETQLRKDIEETNKKLKMLINDASGTCPLCEQTLGISERRKIELKYQEEIKDKYLSSQAVHIEISSLHTALSAIEKELALGESKLRIERARLQGQISVLLKTISEVMDAMNTLAKEKESFLIIERKLAERNFALDERKGLEGVENQITGLKYDDKRHQEAKQAMIDTLKYEEKKQKLDEAAMSIDAERAALVATQEEESRLKNTFNINVVLLVDLEAELKVLPQIADDLAAAQADQKVTAADLRNILDKLVMVKEKLRRLSELETIKKEKEKQLAQASEQAIIHWELSYAFGKKGIQALLIELALPELEIEADRLLSRMTDNRMHIKIETQRETKQGNVAETLDINVSDELGTRNYELFSGGEAFRINFAIRIALSRLLAHRAGAPLPTLIIDEGFGTQDSTGIEKLKEAINSIQDDFEKILVITHIDDLKDAFPSRIEVVKTANGSTISVN